ncbi:MAG: penicillin-binding protein 2 [Candidatus Omnitrophota bacterium]
MMSRFSSFKNLVVLLFILLTAGLFNIQVIRGNYYLRLSEHNRIRLLPLIAPRGRIFDRQGNVLVDNRLTFNVSIVPQEVRDLDKLIAALSACLSCPQEELRKKYKRNFFATFSPVVVAGDIDKKTAFILEEKRNELNGVILQTQPSRHYIYGHIGAHLLGYVGKIAPGELEKLSAYGYTMLDQIGKTGLEKTYDQYLRGQTGGTQIEVDNYGKKVKVLGHKEPTKGQDLTLTIDIDLQKQATELLAGRKGAITVLDVQNGDILAMVSMPDFDPNIFISGKSKEINDLLKDRAGPFLNRNFDVNCAYPPGSTFKIVNAAAALELNKITAHTPITCNGKIDIGNRTFNCWRRDGHGEVDIVDALRFSCNVFFWRVGMMLGPSALAAYAKKFGLGQAIGLENFYQEKGVVPELRWKRQEIREPWYKGDTLNFSIGQGYLLATPLQVLLMGSVIASDGKIVIPRIIKTDDEPKFINTGISLPTITIVKKGMEEAVASDYGTGHRAYRNGLSLAAKTGTAQAGKKKSHAWFLGFTPVAKPQIAFVIFLEQGGHGGDDPADIAAGICEFLKQKGYV